MSVIEASSVNVKTMADNTLRLTVDIEPRFAKDAFALFSERGTPIALAALRVAGSKASGINDLGDESAPQQAGATKPRGGLLSQWAALRCQEPAFCDWLAKTYPARWIAAPSGLTTAGVAAHVIRVMCDIESRAELDHSQHAAARFDQYVRVPWQKHYQAAHA